VQPTWTRAALGRVTPKPELEAALTGSSFPPLDPIREAGARMDNARFTPACSSPPCVALRPRVAARSPMIGVSLPRRRGDLCWRPPGMPSRVGRWVIDDRARLRSRRSLRAVGFERWRWLFRSGFAQFRLGLNEFFAELAAGLEARIALRHDGDDLTGPRITALALLLLLHDEAAKPAQICGWFASSASTMAARTDSRTASTTAFCRPVFADTTSASCDFIICFSVLVMLPSGGSRFPPFDPVRGLALELITPCSQRRAHRHLSLRSPRALRRVRR
jgi:hypothetical protein